MPFENRVTIYCTDATRDGADHARGSLAGQCEGCSFRRCYVAGMYSRMSSSKDTEMLSFGECAIRPLRPNVYVS